MVGGNVYGGTRGGSIVCVESSNLGAKLCVDKAVGFPILCMGALRERYVVVGGEAKRVEVWDVVEGKRVVSLDVDSHVVRLSSFSSGGNDVLVCVTLDGELYCWSGLLLA